MATLKNAVEREVYGARAAEAAGVTAQAMKIEVDKTYRRNQEKSRRQEEKKALDVKSAAQPRHRSIRYDDVRSAVAEEGLLRLLLLEPELIRDVSLRSEQFSSPLLGRVYAAFRFQHEAGYTVGIASLGEDFTAEETAHLSAVLQKSGELVSESALQDYIRVITAQYEKRLPSGEEKLRAMQERKKYKSGYGG